MNLEVILERKTQRHSGLPHQAISNMIIAEEEAVAVAEEATEVAVATNAVVMTTKAEVVMTTKAEVVMIIKVEEVTIVVAEVATTEEDMTMVATKVAIITNVVAVEVDIAEEATNNNTNNSNNNNHSKIKTYENIDLLKNNTVKSLSINDW